MTATDSRKVEADAIGARHPHVRGACPPHAAALHRLASFITTEDLPPANLSISADGRAVQVTATGCEFVENTVRRWAAALDLTVTEGPTEENGFAATFWSASGWDGTGCWWLVAGSELLPTAVTA